MRAIITTPRTSRDSAVAQLSDEKSPILVEARFPGMATAPDWYLCHEPHEISTLAECFGAGVELHLRSVWDLGTTVAPMVTVNS